MKVRMGLWCLGGIRTVKYGQGPKGPEQVNKGKVGPRVMWAQGSLVPRRMQDT